ncbi:MAG TPA: SpoIID/LytB domain-containing protein [Chloroflexota bacterium]|nr:SpoIID/LytB domain-containing protein [Chloroflexota bacterium]
MIALPGLAQVASHPTTGMAASVAQGSLLVGLRGTVIDLATLLPVSGVLVRVEPGAITTLTDPAGTFALSLPPASHSVEFSAPGYITETHLSPFNVDAVTTIDAKLFPAAPTNDQQVLLYARSVRQFASPLVDQQTMDRLGSAGALMALPATITVYYDHANPPYMINVPLEDYVKGVVPNEVPPSWPGNTLQAQAVAARSYGVASQLAYGFVYPDTRSQVYDPYYRTSTTDAATDATAGVVVTVNGFIVFTFFFSSCNGVTTRDSENVNLYKTDQNGNIVHNNLGQAECLSCTPGVSCWNYVSYCRHRSCNLHAPSSKSDCGYWGHGVGLCQWGAFSRSNLSFADILNSYYTGVTIADFAPTPTPTPTCVPSPTPLPVTPTPSGSEVHRVLLPEIGNQSRPNCG